jgi:hypothetical protein
MENKKRIEKKKKQPLGKLASKRLRIAKSLEKLQKRVHAFKASLNNIKEG